MTDPKEALERLIAALRERPKGAPGYDDQASSIEHQAADAIDALIAIQEGLEREVARLGQELEAAKINGNYEQEECAKAESKLSALNEKAADFQEWLERTRDERNFPAHLFGWCEEAGAWLDALLDPAVPVESKGLVSSTKGGGDQENLCGSGAQGRPSRGSPTDCTTSEGRCETCGLFSREWMDWMRAVKHGVGRLEDHCRCAETRQAEIEALSAKLALAETGLETVRFERDTLRSELRVVADQIEGCAEALEARFPEPRYGQETAQALFAWARHARSRLPGLETPPEDGPLHAGEPCEDAQRRATTKSKTSQQDTQ